MFCRYDFLSEEQNTLLSLVSDSLSGRNDTVLSETVDFAGVWREAEIQTVLLLAMNRVDAENFPENEKNAFKKRMQSYFMKNIAVGTEHNRLHTLLTDAGVPYSIIKGMASAVLQTKA